MAGLTNGSLDRQTGIQNHCVKPVREVDDDALLLALQGCSDATGDAFRRCSDDCDTEACNDRTETLKQKIHAGPDGALYPTTTIVEDEKDNSKHRSVGVAAIGEGSLPGLRNCSPDTRASYGRHQASPDRDSPGWLEQQSYTSSTIECLPVHHDAPPSEPSDQVTFDSESDAPMRAASDLAPRSRDRSDRLTAAQLLLDKINDLILRWQDPCDQQYERPHGEALKTEANASPECEEAPWLGTDWESQVDDVAVDTELVDVGERTSSDDTQSGRSQPSRTSGCSTFEGGYLTVHGKHRPDGSLDGYRTDRNTKRTKSDSLYSVSVNNGSGEERSTKRSRPDDDEEDPPDDGDCNKRPRRQPNGSQDDDSSAPGSRRPLVIACMVDDCPGKDGQTSVMLQVFIRQRLRNLILRADIVTGGRWDEGMACTYARNAGENSESAASLQQHTTVGIDCQPHCIASSCSAAVQNIAASYLETGISVWRHRRTQICPASQDCHGQRHMAVLVQSLLP